MYAWRLLDLDVNGGVVRGTGYIDFLDLGSDRAADGDFGLVPANHFDAAADVVDLDLSCRVGGAVLIDRPLIAGHCRRQRRDRQRQ